MGHRLSRITTRTGDSGSTGLGDGSRVAKDSPRIEAIGNIDELNSQLGVVLSHELTTGVRDHLTPIQHTLFDLGGELCLPGQTRIGEEDIAQLEQTLSTLNISLPPLQDFILPGGSAAAAACHVARAVCRRAERSCWHLAGVEMVNPHSLVYLNRLSDLLFVIARILLREEGGSEVIWHSKRKPA